MKEQSTLDYLNEHYPILIEIAYTNKQLSQTMRTHLLTLPTDTLDDIEQSYKELNYAVRNNIFYMTLDSIERGEIIIKKETDPTKREKFEKRLEELKQQLERMDTPS